MIVGTLCFNQMLVYLFSIFAFVVPLSHGILVDIVLAGFLGYLYFFELVALITSRGTVKVNLCNPYLSIQIWQGLLNKAGIISLGMIGGYCF